MHFTLNVIAFGFNIAIIVSVVVVITFDYGRFDIVERMVRNWETPLISDVAVMRVSEYNDNEDERRFVPLFNYSFPGVEEGCDCSGVVKEGEGEGEWEGMVLKGKCDSVQLRKGCIGVDKVSEVNVYNVDRESEKTIFVKRSNKGNTYMKWYLNGNIRKNCSYIVGNITMATRAYRSCGVIDTLNNHLCVEEHLSCPYVNVTNTNTNNNNNNNSNNPSNVLLTIINDIITNTHLYIDTISTPSQHICINPTETPFTTVNTSYPLYSFKSSPLNINLYECHTHIINPSYTYDTTYTPLTSFPINTSFPSPYLSLLHSLPQFPYTNFTSQHITLFHKGYSGWDSSCMNYISTIYTLSSMKYYFKRYFTLFLIDVLVIFPYYLLFIMIITQIDHMNHKLHLILHMSYIVLIVVLMIMVALCYKVGHALSSQMNVVVSKSCGDAITSHVMLNIYDDMNIIVNKVLHVEMWLVLMMCSYGLKVILVFTKMNKRAMMALLVGRDGGVEGNRGVITMMEIEMITI